MKRYDNGCESPSGEWVKFEDAQREVVRLRECFVETVLLLNRISERQLAENTRMYEELLMQEKTR